MGKIWPAQTNSQNLPPHKPRIRPKFTGKCRNLCPYLRREPERNPNPAAFARFERSCSDQRHVTLEIRTQNPVETAPARTKTHQKPWKKKPRIAPRSKQRGPPNSRDAEASTSVLEPSPSNDSPSHEQTLRNQTHPAIPTRENPRIRNSSPAFRKAKQIGRAHV